MNEYPFRRSRFWGWLSVIVFIAMPLIFTWFLLQPYLRSHAGDVLLLSVLLCAAVLLTFGSLSHLLVVQLLTSYGQEGIRQPSLFGPRFLAWRDVREVRNLTEAGLELVGPDLVIPVNFSVFEDRRALVEEIRSRIPASAYPEPGKRRQEDRLRRQRVVGFVALLNAWCAVLILLLGRNSVTIVLAVIFLVLAILSAWRWIKLRDLQQ